MTIEKKGDKVTLKYNLTIDSQKFEWSDQWITGAQLKTLGNIASEVEVFLIQKGEEKLIEDNSQVDLSDPGLEKFVSKFKTVTLVVSGKPKEWDQKIISFEQVVTLAFGSYVNDGRAAYTVTYSRGPKENRDGSMVRGDVVFVKNKMIFNVTATDKS